VADIVRCPSCGTTNPAPQGNSPFFCTGCKKVVDPGGVLRRAPEASRATVGAANVAGGYVSRFQEADPREVQSSQGVKSIGGSVPLGYLLAAVAGLGGAAAFGMLGLGYLRLPILAAFVVGWLIRRALALGSGGGTPDRGPIGIVLLVGIALVAFGILRWFDYQSASASASKRYDEMYGRSAAAAVADPEGAVGHLSSLATDTPTIVKLRTDGSEVFVSEEAERLRMARATGKTPRDGYDIEVLASTGKAGLRGHMEHGVRNGEVIRITRRASGFRLPGPAMVVLWVAELAILIGMSFRRID
jgi:hypothetical protein